jgi:hypothetical protein
MQDEHPTPLSWKSSRPDEVISPAHEASLKQNSAYLG